MTRFNSYSTCTPRRVFVGTTGTSIAHKKPRCDLTNCDPQVDSNGLCRYHMCHWLCSALLSIDSWCYQVEHVKGIQDWGQNRASRDSKGDICWKDKALSIVIKYEIGALSESHFHTPWSACCSSGVEVTNYNFWVLVFLWYFPISFLFKYALHCVISMDALAFIFTQVQSLP